MLRKVSLECFAVCSASAVRNTAGGGGLDRFALLNWDCFYFVLLLLGFSSTTLEKNCSLYRNLNNLTIIWQLYPFTSIVLTQPIPLLGSQHSFVFYKRKKSFRFGKIKETPLIAWTKDLQFALFHNGRIKTFRNIGLSQLAEYPPHWVPSTWHPTGQAAHLTI